MNILNLPSPTAGAELGRSTGQALGMLGSLGYNVLARNSALDYLNKILPQQEPLEGTNANVAQYYTQADREKVLRNAPFLLRGQVNDIIDQRNQSSMLEREMASNYSNRAEDLLQQIYPNATPTFRSFIRTKAIEGGAIGKPQQQIEAEISQLVKQYGDSIGALESSVKSLRKSPGAKFFATLTGQKLDTDQLIDTLRTQAAPLVQVGQQDLVRRILAERELDLLPSEIEKIAGGSIGTDVLKKLNDLPKYKTKFDEDLKIYKPESLADLKGQLEEIFKLQPNVNLVILRDELEKRRKTDWQSYLNAINELQSENKIQLSPEQRNSLAILKAPERDIATKALEFVSLEKIPGMLKDLLKGLRKQGATRKQVVGI